MLVTRVVSLCAAIVLLSSPAAAQKTVFVEGLRELAREMQALSPDNRGVNQAIDKMAAGLDRWEPAPAPLSGDALLGDETAGTPLLPLAAYADGFSRIRRGEYHDAIVSLRRAAASTTDERSRLATAGRLAQQGRQVEAERALRSIVGESPQSGMAHWWPGRVYENLNQASDAHREYEAALSVALTGRASLYAAIGRVARAEGDFARAVTAYEQRVRLSPNDAPAHKYLGWIYLEQDRRDEALAEYEAATRLDRRDGEAFAALGRILLDADRAADAVAALTRAVELLPEQHDTRYALALALRQAGQPEAAARQIELFARAARQSLADRRRQMAADVAKEEAARRDKCR